MEVVALGEGTPHELNTRPLWQGMVGKPPQHMACEASAPTKLLKSRLVPCEHG